MNKKKKTRALVEVGYPPPPPARASLVGSALLYIRLIKLLTMYMYQHVSCHIKLINLGNLSFGVYSRKEVPNPVEIGTLLGTTRVMKT